VSFFDKLKRQKMTLVVANQLSYYKSIISKDTCNVNFITSDNKIYIIYLQLTSLKTHFNGLIDIATY
jgi:hypothetical protein